MRLDPKQLAEVTFDLACLGLLVAALGFIWTLGAVVFAQIFVTCLIVGMVAAVLANQIEQRPSANTTFTPPKVIRQDTVSEPVPPTDEPL